MEGEAWRFRWPKPDAVPRQGQVGGRMQPTLTSAMGGFTARKDELAECAHNARSPQVTAGGARENEITAAQLRAPLRGPHALDFAEHFFTAYAPHLPAYSEPWPPFLT